MKYAALFHVNCSGTEYSNRSKNIGERVEVNKYKEGTTNTSPGLLVDTESWQNSIFVLELQGVFFRIGQVSRMKAWKPLPPYFQL